MVTYISSEHSIDRFKTWLSRNLSPVTIDQYVVVLGYFLNFCRQSNLQINSEVVDSYLIHLQESGYKSNTIRTYYYSIRKYFQFMHRSDELANIPLPWDDSEEPEPVTEQDFKQLLGYCERYSDFIILLLLWDIIPRITELITLKKANFHLSEGYVEIIPLKKRGPPSKRKPVPVKLSSVTVGVLENYLSTVQHEDDFILQSPTDRTRHISKETVRYRLKSLCKRAGIPYKKPHLFRHGRTTALANEGISPIILMQFGRWSSLRSMERYIHRDDIAHMHGNPVPDILGGE